MGRLSWSQKYWLIVLGLVIFAVIITNKGEGECKQYGDLPPSKVPAKCVAWFRLNK